MSYKKIPVRYLPKNLSRNDKKKQLNMLSKSVKMYKKNKYYLRKKVTSFSSKPSAHVVNAKKIYNLERIVPDKKMALATGCSVSALSQIVKKGEGAYYSSGSRPNQTPQSWGFARLASSVTGGKAAAVDYDIISNGCNHKKKAYILATKSRKINKFGKKQTRKVRVKM